MDMYETRNKFAFVDIMCANCLYIKHKFQRYVFPITTASPRKPTYFFCFSFASNYKNRVWRNEVMMKKQVRKHVTNARNELIHFRIKITVRKHVTNAHNNQKQFKFTHFRIKIPLLLHMNIRLMRSNQERADSEPEKVDNGIQMVNSATLKNGSKPQII